MVNYNKISKFIFIYFKLLNYSIEFVKPNFKNKQLNHNHDQFNINEQYFINKYINQYLRNYQREGIKFLFDNFLTNNGCILADDMGLGMIILKYKKKMIFI